MKLGALCIVERFLESSFQLQLPFSSRAIDFNDAESLEGVALYGCPPPGATVPITPPPPPLPPPPSVRPNVTVGLSGAPGSFIAVEVTEAQIAGRWVHLGILELVLLADILLEIAAESVTTASPTNSLLSLPPSFDILLEFQTISSSALILYTQGLTAMFADYMALELRGGQLYFSYNLGSGRAFIVSTGTYDDGLLHRVGLTSHSVMSQQLLAGFSFVPRLHSPAFNDKKLKSWGVVASLVPRPAPVRFHKTRAWERG